jgi:hypothetical protein
MYFLNATVNHAVTTTSILKTNEVLTDAYESYFFDSIKYGFSMSLYVLSHALGSLKRRMRSG